MKLIISTLLISALLASCSDMLDKAPLDQITPEVYFTQSNQLGDYAIKYYSFPVLKGYTDYIGDDNDTDIQIAGVKDRWVPGEWRVKDSGSEWKFERIRAFNYFFEQVLPKFEQGEISGSEKDIKHYIGEVHFLRAYEYFKKMKEFGDFPIITEVLSEDKDILIKANERKPFNHVARFILSDLDKAIEYMSSASDDGNRKTRLTKNAALLFKSRVALYAGTWLKYFKGTAFVPGGENWPGASKEYNSGLALYETNIDDEIRHFLTESLSASGEVADKLSLTTNTFDDPTALQLSPYVRMFADYDLSTYSEIIFWKDYDLSKGISHSVNNVVQWPVAGGGSGYSKGYIESFLMINGRPIYAEGSEYAGDLSFPEIRQDRDDRLRQFIKATGDVLYDGFLADHPSITSGGELSTTGYVFKKYKSNKANAASQGEDTGSPIFRVAEAYLNYMEADYELNGVVSGKSAGYWTELRSRVGITEDYNITDQYTDMNLEAKNNFAAYSAGQLIDKTLYNIRRERQSELMSEGFRYDDLKRWRSMDQLITTPYHPEGFNLWGSSEFESWYGGKLFYLGDDSGKQPNMSSPELSSYIRPHQKAKNNLLYGGMKWTPAHYLSPIDMGQFNITSQISSGEIDHNSSPIYQNPGWPTIANQGPEMLIGF